MESIPELELTARAISATFEIKARNWKTWPNLMKIVKVKIFRIFLCETRIEKNCFVQKFPIHVSWYKIPICENVPPKFIQKLSIQATLNP